MHLRRIVLLFAIVLGFSALAASISPRAPEREEAGSPTLREPRPSSEPPAPRGEPFELAYSSRAARPVIRTLPTGARAIVTVSVAEPGDIEIAGLGLFGSAEPRTPATFDVVALEPGRHIVRFTPAGETAARTIGVVVVSAARARGAS